MYSCRSLCIYISYSISYLFSIPKKILNLAKLHAMHSETPLSLPLLLPPSSPPFFSKSSKPLRPSQITQPPHGQLSLTLLKEPRLRAPSHGTDIGPDIIGLLPHLDLSCRQAGPRRVDGRGHVRPEVLKDGLIGGREEEVQLVAGGAVCGSETRDRVLGGEGGRA